MSSSHGILADADANSELDSFLKSPCPLMPGSKRRVRHLGSNLRNWFCSLKSRSGCAAANSFFDDLPCPYAINSSPFACFHLSPRVLSPSPRTRLDAMVRSFQIADLTSCSAFATAWVGRRKWKLGNLRSH
eukprot:gnl/TRDRNA2_/TRDRNA2_55181_c1_seq1.p1 gnl/TRDRNA2_/TRDRNA2_55181_c1~~gnl/TRDRNA2_/TRDRNA2_55181_c1_seq1.p1  ORF type:complete len:131 (-),score=4.00 gnl/TRDRNA2_/TRDRNA2_55181_c1_seq1:566-958(-)